MSQVSIIDIEGNNPEVPTNFIEDTGNAVPIANQLEILGQKAYTSDVPVMWTLGSGNTVSIENRTWETAYVVDSSTTVGERGTFSTVQSAINAAIADGVSTSSNFATILLRNNASGYLENVNIPIGACIHIKGIMPLPVNSEGPITIIGNFTATGAVVFLENIYLQAFSGYAFSATSADVNLNNARIDDCFLDGTTFRAVDSFINGLETTGAAGNSFLTLEYCKLSGGSVVNWNITNSSFITMNFCNWIQATGSIQFNGTSGFTINDCNRLSITGNTTNGGTIQNTSFKDTINLPNVTQAFFGTISESDHAAAKADLITTPLSPIVLLASYEGNITYRRIVTGNGDVTANDQYVACRKAGALALTLSSAVDVFKRGQKITIADELGSAVSNPITITPGAGTINGGASIVINENYGVLEIIFDGTNWFTDPSATNETLTGNTGGAISPSSGNWNIVTSNATVGFAGSGSTLTQDFASSSNIVLGSSLPSLAGGVNNTGLGTSALSAITSGGYNIAIGNSSGTALTTGEQNVAVGTLTLVSASSANYCTAIGYQALIGCNGDNNTAIGRASLLQLASGTDNTAVGFNSGFNILGSDNTLIGSLALANGTGSDNIAIGYQAGSAYVGAEASNLVIGNTGVATESNVIRIGTQGAGAGQQNTAFMAGVFGVTVGASGVAVVVDNAGQLGTVVSSIRYKENIKDLEEISDRILRLRPVVFDYIANKQQGYGLIAEEVAEVMPELAVTDESGQIMTVKYQDLPILILNELQKLVKRVDNLENKTRS